MEQEIQVEIQKIRDEYEDFKKFAFKDSIAKMAVAFIMGATFEKVIKAFASNIVMPIVNYFLSQTGTDWRKWHIVPVNGMNIEIGQFIGSFLDFFITAIILYFLYIKLLGHKNEDNS